MQTDAWRRASDSDSKLKANSCNIMERSEAMTLSVIVAVVIAAAVFYWLIRSRRKEAHHLDDLHINPEAGEEKD